jgi:hypothetical protein
VSGVLVAGKEAMVSPGEFTALRNLELAVRSVPPGELTRDVREALADLDAVRAIPDPIDRQRTAAPIIEAGAAPLARAERNSVQVSREWMDALAKDYPV